MLTVILIVAAVALAAPLPLYFTATRRLVGTICELSTGMVYISEQDHPVATFYLNGHSIEQFEFWVGGTEPQRFNFDAWFGSRISNERWRDLYWFLDRFLEDTRVVKVNRGGALFQIYAVGTYRGSIVGVQMMSIET